MIYDVIIIGAGVAGLAAALELSRAGRRVLVLEGQLLPGGFGTGFSRRSFFFESAIHCVDGLHEGGDVFNFLKTCGIDKEIEPIPFTDFARIIYPDYDFVADFDIDNFQAYLSKEFPSEAEGLRRLFAEFKRFAVQFERYAHLDAPAWLKNLLFPFLCPSLLYASCISIEQLISRYVRSKEAQAIITDIWRFMGLPPHRLSALYFLIVFKGYYYDRAFLVKNGFKTMFKAMSDKIRAFGSEVRFNTAVGRIIPKIEQGRRSFVVTTDTGEMFISRAVVSNANPIDTLTRLLDDDVVKKEYRDRLSKMEKTISAFQVYLGLSSPAKDLGMKNTMYSINSTYNHEDSFNYCLNGDYEKVGIALVDHVRLDSSFVPQGKGSLLIMSLDNYANWVNLDQEAYNKKKQDVARIFIRRAEQFIPQLSKHIEVMEIATPRTIERYGVSPDGAIYGFAQTPKQSGSNRLPQKTTVPGLFLAGAWTFPGGGVHACIISGLEAANLVKKYLA